MPESVPEVETDQPEPEPAIEDLHTEAEDLSQASGVRHLEYVDGKGSVGPHGPEVVAP